MKGKWTWFSGAVLGAVIVFGMVASAANAQSYYKGKFDLPFKAHWGLAVLPAGEYVFSIASDDGRAMVTIRNAKTLQHVAFETVEFQESSAHGKSALLIGTRGEQQIVHSIRIAELGETFVCDPALADEDARTPVQARNSRDVPVIVAEK